MLKSFDSIKETHELKTARLIQVALLTSYLVIENPKGNLPINYRMSLDLLKLGKAMGLAFQFIDDLSELTSESLTKHEKEINPWLNHSRKVLEELYKYTWGSTHTRNPPANWRNSQMNANLYILWVGKCIYNGIS